MLSSEDTTTFGFYPLQSSQNYKAYKEVRQLAMQVRYLGIKHELETGNAICIQTRVSTAPRQDQGGLEGRGITWKALGQFLEGLLNFVKI